MAWDGLPYHLGMKRPILNVAAIALLVFNFVVPKNLWDWIEFTKQVQEFSALTGLPLPSTIQVVQWSVIVAGLTLVGIANREWMKEWVQRIYNPIVLLPDAALIARKRLTKTMWEEVMEGHTKTWEDSLSWFGTLISMSVPVLGKKATSLDFAPIPSQVFGTGTIKDGATSFVTYGGDKIYIALAVRARDLYAAIRSMKTDHDKAQAGDAKR